MSFLLTTRPPWPAANTQGRTLLDVFAQTVERCRERTAIDAPGRLLSYQELRAAVGELGDRLGALGIGPGDRVGVQIASGAAQLYTAVHRRSRAHGSAPRQGASRHAEEVTCSSG